MVIQLKDNKAATVFELRDMLELTELYMGCDARVWLEEFLADLQKEMDDEQEERKEYLRDVLRDLRKHSEKLNDLLGDEELDRAELTREAEKIGAIIREEMP